MSYRTNVNGKQIFGNNEWYDEWGEYLISKGIKISDEGLYKGELDDFMEALEVIEKITMNIEAKRRERKEAGGKFFSQSIFDNGGIGYQVDPLGAYGSELIDMWNCTEDDFVKEILSLEAAPIVRDGITYFESEEEVDEPPMYVPMKQ